MKNKTLMLASVAAVALVALQSGAALAAAAASGISDVTVTSSITNKATSIKLPYSTSGQDGEKLDYNFKLAYEKGGNSVFRVVPDDCVDVLEVNGKAVDFPTDPSVSCDWQKGFNVDLKDYLKPGSNSVHIVVSNKAVSTTGLRFEPGSSVEVGNQ